MIIFIPKRFEEATLENYNITIPEQQALIDHLKQSIKQGFKSNMFISGGVGTGKTHLAYATLKSLEKADKKELSGEIKMICRSKRTVYTSAKEIIDTTRATWKKEPDTYDLEKLADIKNSNPLIIDEIGVQYGTESERLELFEIINYRYNEMLPTICLSNLDREQIAQLLGQRISDRLFSGAVFFELTGKSAR